MMPPVVGSVAAPRADVFDHVRRRSSSAMWTEDKRRRTTGSPSRPLGAGSFSEGTKDAMLMDNSTDTLPQVQQEDEFVFSAEDDIDGQELSRYIQQVKLREPFYVQSECSLDDKGAEEVYQRLCALRLRHYKMLQEGSLDCDDTTASVPASDYPGEVFNWNDPLEPCASIFGWTYDPDFLYHEDLDDYQRIVPTRADLDEYSDWDKYRFAFSTYETDEEYVKYLDELSKKMKWVEDALLLDHEQFLRYEYRGARQAMKIAAGFCHLPASLATLGYEEYVLGLRYDLDRRKGYDQVFFEIWKRVSKQEMSFIEALKDILKTGNKLPSSCLYKIQAEFKGYRLLQIDFKTCMAHIRELVGDVSEGTVLKKHFTDAVYSKITIPKMYVDYAKKKLEVARLINLNPGMGRSHRIENRTVGACTHNASINWTC